MKDVAAEPQRDVADVRWGAASIGPAGSRHVAQGHSSHVGGRRSPGIFDELAERYLPDDCRDDPELGRRARLITRMGIMGFLFGIAYTVFYLAIGHYYGAATIIVCSTAFLFMPAVMKATGSVDLAGNALAGIMTVGFIALCCMEGGLDGHAIAWLVSVPLCALLLVGTTAATWWVIICFIAGAGVAVAHVAGAPLPLMFDEKWRSLVSAMGYLGLILFMFLMGMIFENGRKRAHDKMQDALKKLETSNARLTVLNGEKDEFLGIAAHDLKNPLMSIIWNADRLETSAPSQEIRELSHRVAGASTAMLDLITDLLDAHAIEAGNFSSRIERLDMHMLVAESVEHNQSAGIRKEIGIDVSCPEGLSVRADHRATVQVLDNLVSNAIKYSPLKSTVTVTSTREPGGILVSVKDQGPGISQKDQQRLFMKFTRLSARPTGGESSTGLGLAIAKRLTEAMGGGLTCRSGIGCGAEFLLRLPEWDEQAARRNQRKEQEGGTDA